MLSCPDTSVLQRLEAGELPDEEADAVWPHVETCEQCTQRIEELRSHDLDARIVRAAARDAGAAAESPVAPGEIPGADSPGGTAHGWSIPDYERVRLCDEGAFGSVWAVRNRVGVFRALKTIHLGHLRDADVQCRESTALETYCRHVHTHPNLIQIFHVGLQGEVLYYVMELADDESTRRPVREEFPATYRPLTLERLMERAALGVNTSVEIVIQLLRGLSRLHAMDLAHRDIKPANIIFVGKRPKVADIGMITTESGSPSRVGTPQYMPPDDQMDLTADTFAMGRILHQLLHGATPDHVPPLGTEALPASDRWNVRTLYKVVEKALAPVATDRYQRAEHMLEAIEACREMSYESLFAEVQSSRNSPPAKPRKAYVPIVVALIHSIPWILGLTLAIVLAQKLL